MNRYSLGLRLLHWTVALLALATLAIGINFALFGFEGTLARYGQPTTNTLYTSHKTMGVLILALMCARLALRWRRGKPAYARPLSEFERVASMAVHHLIYALLFLVPVLGWLATGAGGYPVEFFGWRLPPILSKDEALSGVLFTLHGACAFLLLALVVVHVGAAFKHAIVDMDGVMDRML